MRELIFVKGALLVAVIGCLTRPSGMLVGQLPFGTVIASGVNQQGLDRSLIPIARQSLNELDVGVLIRAALGGPVGVIFHPQGRNASPRGGTYT